MCFCRCFQIEVDLEIQTALLWKSHNSLGMLVTMETQVGLVEEGGGYPNK